MNVYTLLYSHTSKQNSAEFAGTNNNNNKNNEKAFMYAKMNLYMNAIRDEYRKV